VDFAEVDRVELERGAFDVTSSGSLGAVVRVVTKKPPPGLRFTPSLAAGSFGFYNPSATASIGRDRFRALVGYSYRTSEPYRDGAGKSFLTYANFSDAAQGKRAFDIHTGWLESEYRPSDRQSIAIAYTRQQSGLTLYPALTMDSDYDNADRGSVNYEIQDLGSIRAIRIQSYFTQVVHYMSDTYRSTAMMNSWMMASNARSRVLGGHVEVDAGKNFTLGVEGYYRNWNLLGYMNMSGMLSANPSLPDVGTAAVGGFVAYRRSITDRLRLTAGARFDHDSMAANARNLNTNEYYSYQGTHSTASRDNYGSGNLRISYELGKQSELFAGAGTTGRIPDAEERYINRASMMSVNVGNPNLPVVRNTEATAGLLFNHGASYLKPTLFYSNVSDYILVNNQPLLNDSTGPPTARSYTNVAARMYGAEMSYALALPRGFSLSGGTSYSKGTNDGKPLAGVFSTSLPEMPPLRTWAALRYVYRYAFTEIGSSAVARQNLVSRDLNESPTPGYALMHLKLGLAYRRIYASLVADNLLNRYYYEHLSYYRDPFRSGVKVPEPGRNLFVQVKYDFGK
jgi:iron complex outermembrane receptor protein